LWRRNLENITGSGSNAGRKTENGGAEKMTMNVARSPKSSVFEVVVLDICDTM
jgi:hypothetical protein